ncbi:hypothetical protein Pint_19383 [Pistacia integerrima]|uniref:Uncharacterized protein n=1 Tax=Pistacia integerrima TaxID=434235 RepID=A0ACC0YYI5_9ROSI|nr:hypothetical protein Pint_19383 [Pistacia integerrima]
MIMYHGAQGGLGYAVTASVAIGGLFNSVGCTIIITHCLSTIRSANADRRRLKWKMKMVSTYTSLVLLQQTHEKGQTTQDTVGINVNASTRHSPSSSSSFDINPRQR